MKASENLPWDSEKAEQAINARQASEEEELRRLRNPTVEDPGT